MAAQSNYDDAWMTGLELQSFGSNGPQCLSTSWITVCRRPPRGSFLAIGRSRTCAARDFLAMAADPDSEIRFYAAYGLGYIHHPKPSTCFKK